MMYTDRFLQTLQISVEKLEDFCFPFLAYDVSVD